MHAFTFTRPSSIDEAVALLSEYGSDAALMAGGQSLLLELKERAKSPRVIVSLDRIAELNGHHNGAGVTIGATTSYRSLVMVPPAGAYAGLASVVADIADRPVRTMATFGGSLCQADPRFDVPAVATLFQADLLLRSSKSSRTISVSEYLTGPFRTSREPTELLCEIRLPERGPDFRWNFQKFRMRAMDAAMVSVGIAVELGANAISDVSVVVSACTELPTRVRAVEDVLKGQTVNAVEIEEAAALTRRSVDVVQRPWPYLEANYLRHMVGVLTGQALARVVAGQSDSEEG